MFDVNIADKNDNEITTTVLMSKKELQEYINRLNDYYEVTYYEMFDLEQAKKEKRKKYFTIDETINDGEKLFKLVEIISDDKNYPNKKDSRIIGAIRVKEREKIEKVS